MAYVLVENGVVVQKGVDPKEGFIEAPNNVVNGFLYDGEEFTAPPPIDKTWDDVKYLQRELLSAGSEAMWRISRYKTQDDLVGQPSSETPAKYQLLLQHYQDVRDGDETTYSTPQEAIDALNALTVPED